MRSGVAPESCVADTAAQIRHAYAGGRQTSSPIAVRAIPDVSPPIIDSRTAVFQDPSPFIQGALAVDFRGDWDVAETPQTPRTRRIRSTSAPNARSRVTYLSLEHG